MREGADMNILIKYREVATYIFFGFFTFITGMSTYILFNVYLGMDALLANVFSWIFAVLIAFIILKMTVVVVL